MTTLRMIIIITMRRNNIELCTSRAEEGRNIEATMRQQIEFPQCSRSRTLTDRNVPTLQWKKSRYWGWTGWLAVQTLCPAWPWRSSISRAERRPINPQWVGVRRVKQVIRCLLLTICSLVSMWAEHARAALNHTNRKYFTLLTFYNFHFKKETNERIVYQSSIYFKLKFICFSKETLHNGVSWYFNLWVGSWTFL